MSAPPSVSVVIPTHNRLQGLLRALDRLASGSVVPDEVILVDDGSEDPVEPHARARQYVFPALRVIRLSPGKGAPTARNTGAHAARSDIVVFMDDDVFANMGTIAAHRQLHSDPLRENQGVMGRVRFDPDMTYTPLLQWLEQRGDFKTVANGRDGAFQAGLISANFSARRIFLQRQTQLFDASFPFNRSEGNEFGCRMVATQGWDLRYHSGPSASHHSPLDIGAYFRQTYQGGICKSYWSLKAPDMTPFALYFGQSFFMKQRESVFRARLENTRKSFADMLDQPASAMDNSAQKKFDSFMRFSRQAMQDIGQFDGWLSLNCSVPEMTEALSQAFAANTPKERVYLLEKAYLWDPLFFPMAWLYAEQLCRIHEWAAVDRVMALFPGNNWARLMRCSCAFAQNNVNDTMTLAEKVLATTQAPIPSHKRQKTVAQEFLDRTVCGKTGDAQFALAWQDSWKDGLHRPLSWKRPAASQAVETTGLADALDSLLAVTMELPPRSTREQLREYTIGGGAPPACNGRVQWYSPEKRFGFIKPSRGNRLLMFHHRNIAGSMEQFIKPGVSVVYAPKETALGSEARDVALIANHDQDARARGENKRSDRQLREGDAARNSFCSAKPRHVVFMGLNTSTDFSGGRYHAWLMAEAAAEMGWQVSFITNNYPSFYTDFDDKMLFPAHKSIHMRICPLRWSSICKLPDIPCDILVVVPHGGNDTAMYEAAISFARAKRAGIVLLNFESANWYNALSPVKRAESKWQGWRAIAQNAAMIVSLAAEGTIYAREYYTDAPRSALFEHCWPTINTRVADALPAIDKEKRILILTRFSHAEHKGGNLVPGLLCEAMRGYTIVFIVGAGRPDYAFLEPIENRVAQLGITIEVLGRVSETAKWREFKRATLVLFPSFFEGFGLPPVEARYAKTPCIAFDLPVLREVNGDGIFYVAPGDLAAMRQKSEELLHSDGVADSLGSVELPPSFEDFATRVDALLKRAFYEGRPLRPAKYNL